MPKQLATVIRVESEQNGNYTNYKLIVPGRRGGEYEYILDSSVGEFARQFEGQEAWIDVQDFTSKAGKPYQKVMGVEAKGEGTPPRPPESQQPVRPVAGNGSNTGEEIAIQALAKSRMESASYYGVEVGPSRAVAEAMFAWRNRENLYNAYTKLHAKKDSGQEEAAPPPPPLDDDIPF